MTRHDYDLPPEWAGMSQDERHRWLTQERCRRQASRQRTAHAERVESAGARLRRRLDARPETIDVTVHR